VSLPASGAAPTAAAREACVFPQALGDPMSESLTDGWGLSPQAWQDRTLVLEELQRQQRSDELELGGEWDECDLTRARVCELGTVLKEALEGPDAAMCETWLNAQDDDRRALWVGALVLATMLDPFFDRTDATQARWLDVCDAAAPLADEVMGVIRTWSATTLKQYHSSPVQLPQGTQLALQRLIGGRLGASL
jgi:hypothetical protein